LARLLWVAGAVAVTARFSRAERAVLAAIVESPEWGLSLCEKTGLAPSTVYPALNRLMGARLITDRWEDVPGAPRRRYYHPAFAPAWYEQSGILKGESRAR
jgi:DNA-binding transcriptional ArsR family regulator